ncbi:hypothetical protein C9I49_28175, partial [Pseudomonas prosekii]
QQSLVQTTRYFPKNRIARFDDCFAAERSLRQLLQGRELPPGKPVNLRAAWSKYQTRETFVAAHETRETFPTRKTLVAAGEACVRLRSSRWSKQRGISRK